MKFFYAVFFFLFTVVSILAQAPEKTSILEGNNQKMAPAPETPEQISYQTVVRGSDNATVANQVVGMRISVLKTMADGTAVYEKRQSPITNANGLLSISIGAWNVGRSGAFSDIVWSTEPYFIKAEINPSGDTGSYDIAGTTQLVSVPYALCTKTAGNNPLKENTANKSKDVATDAASDVKFLSVKFVNTYVDIVQADVDANEIASTTSDAALQVYIDALEARIAVFEPANSGSNFTDNDYWNSTEFNNDFAWFYYFLSGGHDITSKSRAYPVRAVRAFNYLII
jgi:hypothetical protein